MQSLFYYSGSLTGSSLFFVPNNDNFDEYYSYDVTNLIVCSSLEQILLYSGSDVLFTVPVENTNVYYLPSTQSAGPVPPDQELVQISTAQLPIFQSSSFNYLFIPDPYVTSSANSLIITGSNYSSSLSQSLSLGFFQIGSGSAFSITISGSGLFYDASLSIIDRATQVTSSYVTSSNAPLYTTFTASAVSILYDLEARTTTTPYIEARYDSTGSMPFSPTASQTSWSAYFNLNPDSVVNSGSSMYLLGGDISEVTSLTFINSNQERAINIFGARELGYLRLPTGSLTSFPTLTNTPNLRFLYIRDTQITSSNLPTGLLYLNTYDVSNNNISGSILDLVSNVSQSLTILSCSYNNLTGSVPSMSLIPALGYLDCSNNQLSGSISSFSASYGLYHFDCSDNALTGSLPSIDDCISLNYFDVSNNKLTGPFINLRNNTLLSYVNYSNNQIADGYAIYNKNAVGQEINIPPSIEYYNCSYNFLSGSLDLSGSSNLVTFIANNNQFSRSLDDGDAGASVLLGCTSLQYFDVNSNAISGSLPPLGDNINLSYFDASDNKISLLSGSFTVPSTLTYFDLENNNLTTASVEGIAGAFWSVFSGSATTGSINVSGSGNAPAVEPAITYFNDLTASGWTVYANNYP